MLCFSIGLPGNFANWCDAVIGRLTGDPAEGTVLCRWPSTDAMLRYETVSPVLDEVGRLLIRTNAPSIVIGARQPEVALRGALADTRSRFVVALEHPRIVAAELFAETGADMRVITRAVANSCALLMKYSPLPGALTVHGEGARADPAGAVLAVAGHLGIAIGIERARQIVDELVMDGVALAPPSADWAAHIPEHALKTLAGAVSGYEECFAGRGFGQLVWNRELFFVGESERRATEVLDLSGGARVLIWGPYIHLPAGSWTAQVYLGVSAEAAGHMLLIEAYAGSHLATASLQPGSGGIFMTDINFALGEPQAVEIRVTVPQNEATGRLAFGRVVLQLAEAIGRPNAIGEFEDIESVLDL